MPMGGNRKHGYATGVGHGFKPEKWKCDGCKMMKSGNDTRWGTLDGRTLCEGCYDKELNARDTAQKVPSKRKKQALAVVPVVPTTKPRKSTEKASSPPPSFAAIILRVPTQERLPDNAAYTNRFYVRSESSGRLYTIAQSKKGGWWSCGCPGWIRHKVCKHLTALQLPGHYEPHQVLLK